MTTTSASFSYKDALLSQNDSTRRKDGTRENVDGSGCAGTNRRSGILSVNQDALNGAKIDIHVPFVRQKKRPTKEVQLFDYFSAATTAKKQTAVKPPPAAAAANERPLAKKNLLRGNVLDKDAPELHKGKTREGKKRPTKTKKVTPEIAIYASDDTWRL
uniref:Uncharacterized protein n=1 Tax=Plectus sambesii TaxID=2011161 RepID=A0A914WHF0_9BILA